MKGHTWGICKNCGKFHGNHPRGAKGIIPWNKGKKMSDEFREKVRINNTGRKWSDEHRNKMILAISGQKRHNTSETLKKLWQNPEFRRNRRTTKGKHHSKETIEKIRYTNLQKRDLHSANGKRNWRNEEFRNKVIKSVNKKPNQYELFVLSILNKNFPNEWKYVGDFSFWIDGRNPDFINCNGHKKIIEVFGNFWHNSKYGNPYRRTEKGTKNHYKKYGFDTLVIWIDQLRSNKAKQNIEKEIINFHNK
jgi:hypothetical protein